MAIKLTDEFTAICKKDPDGNYGKQRPYVIGDVYFVKEIFNTKIGKFYRVSKTAKYSKTEEFSRGQLIEFFTFTRML